MEKDKITALIPKNKFDTSTLDELTKINEEEMKTILPDLILWIADFNWPIAKEMIKILTIYPNSLVPVIKKSLDPFQTDDILKYWIILKLIPELSREYRDLLRQDIERIYREPTLGEISENVHCEAKILLHFVDGLPLLPKRRKCGADYFREKTQPVRKRSL